ncbi:MAG TPA: class I SAM-dependent methyltransferase [Polyangiaceae bacterium]|jgi:SAM-dependent methyltransferase|nr:class I SAM-dependent methyltransferase [Polyangiaceae bacterium]
MPQTQRQRSSRAPRFSAKTADKHVLYQLSVQAPDAEVEFLTAWFKKIRQRKPLSLREDFCGSALLCAHWVQSNKQRTATGIDIDKSVLKWGTKHNLAPLGPDQERIKLLRQDVRGKVASKHDIVCAFNFSYWIFKTRAELRDYFARVRSGLVKDGLFFLDAYGGWEANEPMQEHRKIKGGFTYVWDQNTFDAITHDVTNFIHFEFKDGTKLKRAFRYDWRFWTMPELREVLEEAGFSKVHVYWDTSEDVEQDAYRVRTRAPNQPGWLAYLVAEL